MFDRFRQKLLESKNYRLKWLFILYIVIITFFAWVYQKFYQADNTTFVFANEVYQTQILNQNRSDSDFIKKLQSEKYYIDSVKKLILQNHSSPDSTFISNGLANTKTFRFKISRIFIDFDINEWACNKELKFEAQHGIYVFDTSSSNKDFFLSSYTGMRIDTFEYDSSIVIARLVTKREVAIDSIIANTKPNIIAKWRILDFLYFSAITQATVGYGDMLPNSTLIRFFVTIQTLLGVLLTVILIAYSFQAFLDERKLKK